MFHEGIGKGHTTGPTRVPCLYWDLPWMRYLPSHLAVLCRRFGCIHSSPFDGKKCGIQLRKIFPSNPGGRIPAWLVIVASDINDSCGHGSEMGVGIHDPQMRACVHDRVGRLFEIIRTLRIQWTNREQSLPSTSIARPSGPGTDGLHPFPEPNRPIAACAKRSNTTR